MPDSFRNFCDLILNLDFTEQPDFVALISCLTNFDSFEFDSKWNKKISEYKSYKGAYDLYKQYKHLVWDENNHKNNNQKV